MSSFSPHKSPQIAAAPRPGAAAARAKTVSPHPSASSLASIPSRVYFLMFPVRPFFPPVHGDGPQRSAPLSSQNCFPTEPFSHFPLPCQRTHPPMFHRTSSFPHPLHPASQARASMWLLWAAKWRGESVWKVQGSASYCRVGKGQTGVVRRNHCCNLALCPAGTGMTLRLRSEEVEAGEIRRRGDRLAWGAGRAGSSVAARQCGMARQSGQGVR